MTVGSSQHTLSALLNWLQLFYGFFGQSNMHLYRALYFFADHEKYTGRNSSNVIFSCLADFARPLARTKNSQKSCAAMQSLIQPILSQIIDSCFYFPERFSDFSCRKYPRELQLLHFQTSYCLNRVFGQKCQK